MLADIVVLATDIFARAPAVRGDVAVKTTIVDGKVVYRAPATAPSSAAAAPAQVTLPIDGVTTKQDVVYGRVEGSALLADIAYPSRRQAAGDHLGARRPLARGESHRRQQHQGGAVGELRLLRDVDRLPAGRRLAGAGVVPRHAVRDPLGARARAGIQDRPGARLPDRPVGRRTTRVARGDARRRAVQALGRVGHRAQRRARRHQRRRPVRAQHAVVGQSLDAGRRGRRSGAQAGVADDARVAEDAGRRSSFIPTTTARCRSSRRSTSRRR